MPVSKNKLYEQEREKQKHQPALKETRPTMATSYVKVLSRYRPWQYAIVATLLVVVGVFVLKSFASTSSLDTVSPVSLGTASASSLTVPSDVVATAVSDNSLTIGWDASQGGSGQVGYEVMLNDYSLGTTTTNSFEIRSLQSNTSYKVSIRSFDEAGNDATATQYFTTKTWCLLFDRIACY